MASRLVSVQLTHRVPTTEVHVYIHLSVHRSYPVPKSVFATKKQFWDAPVHCSLQHHAKDFVPLTRYNLRILVGLLA